MTQSENITRESLQDMTPDQVVDALRGGRLNHLLAGQDTQQQQADEQDEQGHQQ